MRIGVVCEGITDLHAITSFFGHSISSAGFQIEFIPLQPDPDATSSEGGWTKVLFWLMNHEPDNRVQQFFTEGLFGGELAQDPLDGILIQMDSDILGHDSFGAYVKDKFGHNVVNPTAAKQRAEEVCHILSQAALLHQMTSTDVLRHVLAPAVESTETWCVAAFSRRPSEFESLSGTNLVNEFMCALERSESRVPKPSYAEVDKSKDRRSRFCKTHASQSERVINGCPRFREAHERLHALANSIAVSGND